MLQTTELRINGLVKKHLMKEIEQALMLTTLDSQEQYDRQVGTRFAKFVGRKFCKFVDSGTSALKLSLVLAGIRPGDEVIVPALTYYATALPILEIGAKPVFVDANEYKTMDVDLLTKAITPQTKCIIPVHMFGHPCDMDPIMEIARENNLKIIEDCCQSHGSTYKGKMTGNFSDVASFSFTMHKNVPAFYGGCVVFDDNEMAELVPNLLDIENDHEKIVQFGRAASRLSPLEMANINTKIKLFDVIKKSKEKIKRLYMEGLEDSCVKLTPDPEYGESVRQHFVVEHNEREKLRAYLRTKNINCDEAYNALPSLGLFKPYGKLEDVPIALRYQNEGVHLPTSPFLPDQDIQHVIDAIKSYN